MKSVRKKLKSKSSFYVYFFLIFGLCFTVTSFAKNTLTYEQWKLQQQKHDLRLKQKVPLLSVESQSSDTNAKAEIPVLGAALRVNINQATAQELSAKLDSIGQKKAKAIVEYREKNGHFKRIEELKNVKGIGDKIYARNQDRLKLHD